MAVDAWSRGWPEGAVAGFFGSRILPFTLAAELDCTLVNLLSPLPGTPVWERLREQRRLLYTDFPADYALYTQDNVCFQPLGMTAKELQDRTRALIAGLTRLPIALRRAVRTWRHTRDARTTLVAYSWNRRTFRALRSFPLRDVGGEGRVGPTAVRDTESLKPAKRVGVRLR